MFQLKNVIKRYSRRSETVTALHCDSLDIQWGEYVAVVGPSGSGKTTLLSVLGGMLTPTEGEVVLDGVSMYRLSPVERSALRGRRMGFVFQTFNLVPYLSALENVQVPLCLMGVDKAEQVARAAALLTKFGLADRMRHRPSELSVGQQQRVALARTLVNDPRIILADEPTGNLDSQSRGIVLETLEECHSEGKTILVVTHDPVTAAKARRKLLLQAGSLEEQTNDLLLTAA